MTVSTLRSALRARTASTHDELDHAVGHFGDRASYGAFARNTYRFRRAIEAAMGAAPQDWQIDHLAPVIALDLADLGLPLPPGGTFPMSLATPAQRLGVAYVLEGSSLGARVLVRAAQKLGLDAQFGARHLSRQAGDHDRWRRFVIELEATTAPHEEVIAAAQAAFRFALSTYAEAVHERA